MLAGYVWLAPAFVLGPLAGLLLMSRPRTSREWIWIVVAVGSSLAWLAQHGSLAGQISRASAVLITGAYIALTLWKPAAGWSRAVAATGLASVALAVLIVWTDVSVADWQRTAANGLQTLAAAVPALYRAQVPAVIRVLGSLAPAFLALFSIVGVQLAWAWHCRLAERPVGERLCTGELNL